MAKGFSLVELLLSLAIVGTLMGFFLPAVQSSRQAARAISCQSNLRQMALALQQYEAAKGELTTVKTSVWTNGYMPEDKVWSSGSFTPYIEESKALPWCPEDPEPADESTSYAFVFSTEKGICSQEFQQTVPRWVVRYMGGGPAAPPQHTAFGINIGLTLSRITDGLSKTAAFGEIRMGDDRSNKEMNAVYSHYRTPNTPEPDVTRGKVDPNIAPVVEGDKRYCVTQVSSARSYHPGGVQTVYVDGHCEFISDDIAGHIWHDKATINGYMSE